MNARRRNGKPASCEPCRKTKVRCDHALPVCSRCQQRGAASRCFYHPAPLTRPSKRPRDEDAANILGTNRLEDQDTPRPYSEPPGSVAEWSSLIPPTPEADDPPLTGYLGPTSFVRALEDDGELPSGAVHQGIRDGGESSSPDLSPWCTRRAIEVVSHLKGFLTIKSLIQDYYNVTQAAVIASPLILNALTQIQLTYENRGGIVTDEQTSTLSASIIQNTRKSFQIPSTVDGTVFHTLFTASSLRLEIIGIICALAGRASHFGLSDGRFRNAQYQAQFSRKMLVASDIALEVCQKLTYLNDLTLWLLHENLLLSSLVLGDSSSVTWRRLGELATGIFELGLHRDITSPSQLPFFILESRRRLFAAAYQLDKSIATLLGRPPRISWRHSDCRLPLDISDDVLAGSPEAVALAHCSLDSEGWSMENVYQRSAWIRLRFIISTFREEILELSLQKPGAERADRLRDVSRRCSQAWTSLPGHLHYTPSCWDAVLPVGIKIMLIISYLAYLYNDFLVQSLLIQEHSGTNPALLEVSSLILSTVLTMGRQRERSVDIQRDFVWIILLYGFSSASVLTRSLRTQVRTGQEIVFPGSRATLIRNLSVFISHLESINRPDQANSPFFSRAIAIFSSIIDEVLEPKAMNAVIETGLDPEIIDDNDVSLFLELGNAELLENIDFSASLDHML